VHIYLPSYTSVSRKRRSLSQPSRQKYRAL